MRTIPNRLTRQQSKPPPIIFQRELPIPSNPPYSLHVSDHNIRADCQLGTLVTLLDNSANAAPV